MAGDYCDSSFADSTGGRDTLYCTFAELGAGSGELLIFFPVTPLRGTISICPSTKPVVAQSPDRAALQLSKSFLRRDSRHSQETVQQPSYLLR